MTSSTLNVKFKEGHRTRQGARYPHIPDRPPRFPPPVLKVLADARACLQVLQHSNLLHHRPATNNQVRFHTPLLSPAIEQSQMEASCAAPLLPSLLSPAPIRTARLTHAFALFPSSLTPDSANTVTNAVTLPRSSPSEQPNQKLPNNAPPGISAPVLASSTAERPLSPTSSCPRPTTFLAFPPALLHLLSRWWSRSRRSRYVLSRRWRVQPRTGLTHTELNMAPRGA
jgi:hypothetical protein